MLYQIILCRLKPLKIIEVSFAMAIRLNLLWIATFTLVASQAISAEKPRVNAEAFYLGAGLHLGQNKTDAAHANLLLSKSHLNSFRDDMSWGRIEVAKGIFSIPDNLSELDHLIRQPENLKQLPPVIMLGYGNKFYDNGDFPRSDEAIAAFAAYAHFVAEHYREQAPLFEIWNEWNGGMGSIKRPREKGTAEDYLRLLKAVVPQIRAVAPKARILAGATSGIDLDWSTRFAELGGMNLVDGFSIHPYNYDHPFRHTPEDAFRGLQRIQQAMVTASGKHVVPFYLTEIGVPTSTGANGYKEDSVASYALRFILLARSLPYVHGIWWYELIDSGDNDQEKEHRFGLFRRSGAAKPAAVALTLLTPVVQDGQNFQYTRNWSEHTITWSKGDGTHYLAHWADTKDSEIKISKNGKEIEFWKSF